MSDDHRDDEAIVEAARFTSPVEADAYVTELKGQGIKAMTSTDDAGGWRPNIGYAQGVRVLVFEDDLEAAQRVGRDLGFIT